MAQPGAEYLAKALAFQAVEAAPADAAHRDEARLLEHAEVARRGRPAVPEARGQVARRQLAAGVAGDDQDVAARLVRERAEDRLGLRRGEPGHTRDQLAHALIVSNTQKCC